MDSHTRSGASAFGWESAMDTYDDPELASVEYYQLPTPDVDGDGPFSSRSVIEGDRFFETEGRYMIEIVDVRTKVYRGVVAPKGERGSDAVFFTTDWNPPRSGGMFSEPHHPHRDDEPFWLTAQDFSNAIEDGALIPHRGNGVTLPP